MKEYSNAILAMKAQPPVYPMTVNELKNMTHFFTTFHTLYNKLIKLDRNCMACYGITKQSGREIPDIDLSNNVWESVIDIVIFIEGNKQTKEKGFYSQVDDMSMNMSNYSDGLKAYVRELDKTANINRYFIKQLFGLRAMREREYKSDIKRYNDSNGKMSKEEVSHFHAGMYMLEDYVSMINEVHKCINYVADRTALLYQYFVVTLTTYYADRDNQFILSAMQNLIGNGNKTVPFHEMIGFIQKCMTPEAFREVNEDIDEEESE